MTGLNPNSLKRTKITLEEYLKENSEFLEFKRNGEFWNNLKLSSQISIEDFVKKDPLVPIVGKKKEIELGKILNYKAALVQLYRNQRNKELVILSLEYEILKNKGFKSHIEDREKELNKNGFDWEGTIKTILNELLGQKKYNRKQLIKGEILNQWPQIFFKTKIDWKRISERIRDELPTPPILYFGGPVGSGKSFLQRQLAESYLNLAEKLGVQFFDYMVIRSPSNKYEAELIRLPALDGEALIRYDEEQKEKRARKKRYAKNILLAGLGSLALWGTWTFGKRLVSVPWGLGIGINPLLDVWMWLQDSSNMDKIKFAFFGTLSFGAYMLYKKNSSKNEDTRPEILSLSTHSAPVYVGDVEKMGLETLIGAYNRKPDEPPQNGFEKKPGVLAADGKPLIWEQIGEQGESVQSWLCQMIQEKEVDIANNGEFKRDYFPVIYMGCNPHKEEKVIPPIKDRVNLGKSAYVTNEIERNIETERELLCFLEYYRIKSEKRVPPKDILTNDEAGKFSIPMDISAMEEAKKASIILSEGKDTLIINRRYLSILDNSFDLAKKEGAGFVTAEHVAKALQVTKSEVEQILENRVESYYKLALPRIIGASIGRVNLIPLMVDEELMSDTQNPIIRRDMAEDNGIAYIASVSALHSNKAGLHLVKNRDFDKTVVDDYKIKLESLVQNINGLNLKEQGITIDLTSVISPDESVITASYIAIKSLINNYPLKQELVVAAGCNLRGELLPLNKINKRILTTSSLVNSYVVPNYDLSARIETSFYPKTKFFGSETVDEAYDIMVVR